MKKPHRRYEPLHESRNVRDPLKVRIWLILAVVFLAMLVMTLAADGQGRDSTVLVPVKWRFAGVDIDSVVRYSYHIPDCPVCPKPPAAIHDTIYKCPPIPPLPPAGRDTVTGASILIRNSGTQTFENWRIGMTNPSGIAFYSYQAGLTVTLTLRGIKQRGGGNTIWSSMTGAVGAKSSFTVENCALRTNTAPIAIYSAYNLVDRVTVRNTLLMPVSSHGSYINNNINVVMENVRTDSMGRGINSDIALSFSHFSSNDVPGWGETTNYFTGCRNMNPANPWRFSGVTYLERDTMDLYDNRGDPSLFLRAKGSILNGWFKGMGDGLTGKSLSLYDTAFISNSGRYEVTTLYPGNFNFTNYKTIDLFGPNTTGTGDPVFATFTDCEIGAVANIPAGSVFVLKGSTKQPPAKWGNPHQPTYVRE